MRLWSALISAVSGLLAQGPPPPACSTRFQAIEVVWK